MSTGSGNKGTGVGRKRGWIYWKLESCSAGALPAWALSGLSAVMVLELARIALGTLSVLLVCRGVVDSVAPPFGDFCARRGRAVLPRRVSCFGRRAGGRAMPVCVSIGPRGVCGSGRLFLVSAVCRPRRSLGMDLHPQVSPKPED